ncbi:MAG: FG-GAP-like repeat-containing protein, partial [Acidobacteriota bacterium]
VADLDGDGDPDLGRSGDGGALAWWNNTAGDGASFTETAITTSASTLEALEPMDLDADGDLDLLLSGGLWLDNSAGDASAWVERTLPTSADGFRYTTGDFDGDGDVDLAGAPWSEDSVGLFFNQSLHRSAVFETARVALSGASDVDSVVAVDIDFDGDLDLISAGGNPDAVTFLENDGSPQDGGWIERTVGLANTFSVASADLDSDGDLDLISCNFASSNITWYENDGDPVLGTWTSYILTGFAGALDCRTVDIDGDGDLDVLANSRGGDLLSWFENNGTPTTVPWTRRDIGTDFDRPLEATSADLDGDGDVDVIGTASNDDAVAWWENDGAPGDGGWTRRDIDTALLEPAGAEPVDLDLDGDLDLVVAALEAPLTWYENDGTPADGGWTKRSIGSGRDAENVRAVDLDRDGDPDLLTTVRTNTGALLWWENDGTPGDGGWVERVVATGLNEPDYADAADLDGDGELDLLASIDGPNQILWYRNIGGQFALPTGDAVAEAVVNEGASDVALLRIDGVHRGRDGDDDAELATLELLFEAAVGDPLSGAELDALVAALRLYLDDGDGVFDPALDAEFYAAAPPFAVTAGLLTLTLVDGDPSARMAVGADVTWWLAADLDGASGSAVPDTFQATHLTSASSTAEMASTDIGLDLEGQDDVTSSAISINALPTLDAPIPNQSAVEGAVYGLDVSVFFSDSEGEPLAFAAAGLPSSLRLVDGEIRGTPSTLDLSASPYSVTVQASDDQDATVQAAFTLTLLDASDALFVDGFESADLSAWSASSP